MKKYIFYIIGVFLLSCSSSSSTKIDFFGEAYYGLNPNEKNLGYAQTPVEPLFKEIASYLFKENQVPVYRIVRSGESYVYVTIPFGIDFPSFAFGELPKKARLISENQTNTIKYIAFESDSMFVSVYLRKIKNNMICMFVFAPNQASFEQIATQQSIDSKIIINEK